MSFQVIKLSYSNFKNGTYHNTEIESNNIRRFYFIEKNWVEMLQYQVLANFSKNFFSKTFTSHNGFPKVSSSYSHFNCCLLRCNNHEATKHIKLCSLGIGDFTNFEMRLLNKNYYHHGSIDDTLLNRKFQ